MTSIRKEKKRLKKRQAELKAEFERVGQRPATWLNVFTLDAIGFEMDQTTQDLQSLKKKQK